MSTHTFDDETMMAFADGELDDAQSASIEAAIAEDPVLAERAAFFAQTANLARTAMAPRLDLPVPPALRAALDASIADAVSRENKTAGRGRSAPGAVVTELDAHRKPVRPLAANENRPVGIRYAAAAAACIAMLVAGFIGYGVGTSGAPSSAPPANAVALLAAPGLDGALGQVASGDESTLADGGTIFRPISTFRGAGDQICREFELTDGEAQAYTAVACRASEDWSIAFAVSTPAGDEGYVPASSLDALESYLTSIEAGLPLSADEERAALGAGD